MPQSDLKISMESSSSKKPSLGHHLMDFANMLKAFIGSNYLAIAFAFRQSGIVLGVIGLVFIATLTAHCCQLLVRCKYHVIRQLLERSRSSNMQLQGDNSNDSLSSTSDDEDESGDDSDDDDQDALHKKLLRNLNFGDIGRLCMGRAGLTLVNSAVMITQFGFCVGYCIFVGNTLHSMFPLYNCSVSFGKTNVSTTVQQCFEVKHLNSLNSVHVDMDGMMETLPGVLQNRRSLPSAGSENGVPGHVNNTVAETTPSTLESLMTFLGSNSISVQHTTTKTTSDNISAFHNISTGTESPTAVAIDKKIHVTDANSTSLTSVAPNITTTESERILVTDSGDTKLTSVTQNVTTTDSERIAVSDSGSAVTSVMPDSTPESGVRGTSLMPVSNSSQGHLVTTPSTPPVSATQWTLLRGKHVPDLKLLVLSPVIVFVPMTLIRNLRHMGFISVLANTSIFIGCIEVFLFLISGFTVSETFTWADWRDLPIFFGMVTSAFEGIGTILPIESSMEGNRHNFISFLYGAVAVLTLVLGCFGVLGYLHFGNGIEQMINANIPTSHWLGLVVNVCLCIGVVLTFPLMMYPVVEMAEVHIFGNGRICGPQTERVKDYKSLLPKKEKSFTLPIAEKVSDVVPTWKRNTLRIFIVLCAGSLAILLRHYFAYISAFVGALGSTMLAYILPCLFHLRLCWSQLSLYTKVKDISIIFIGLFCGAAGVYSVLLEILSSLKA